MDDYRLFEIYAQTGFHPYPGGWKSHHILSTRTNDVHCPEKLNSADSLAFLMRGEIRVGVLGGSGVYDLQILDEPEMVEVDTTHGKPSCPVRVGTVGGRWVAFLPRHGKRHGIPAHRLPHEANLLALKKLGVERVVSTSSVGSLRMEIEPSSFLVPDDFFSPWKILTFYDSEVKHVTPSLDEDLREGLIETGKNLNLRVHDTGTYVQTIGPRLETKAEIRAMTEFGDVVGMTMASEATLANELDMDYACLCIVDNYCNGLVEEPLTYEKIVENQKTNAENAQTLISKFLGELK
jgi:5'-methylthioadenosine phosphorylase